MSRDELQRTLGEPDDFSLEKSGRKPRILKYGNLEFHFSDFGDDAELVLIYMETDDGVVSVSIPRFKP